MEYELHTESREFLAQMPNPCSLLCMSATPFRKVINKTNKTKDVRSVTKKTAMELRCRDGLQLKQITMNSSDSNQNGSRQPAAKTALGKRAILTLPNL